MPRPIASPIGVFQLNIRVTSDLAAKVDGTVLSLPIGKARIDVRPSDKVVVSLRTRGTTPRQRAVRRNRAGSRRIGTRFAEDQAP